MSPRRTRPLFLRLLAVLFAFALIAAACGDDDTASDDTTGDETTGSEDTGSEDTGSTATTGAELPTPVPTDEPSDFDPEGILRINGSIVDTTSVTQFDLAKVIVPADTGPTVHSMIYGTLLRRLADGTYEPHLALGATAVDPQTITIELRPDVVFSDGSPFNAEAVKTGIEHNIAAFLGPDGEIDTRGNADGNSNIAAEMAAVEEVTVEDDLNLTVHLSAPTAGAVYPLLARGEFMIPSAEGLASGNDFQENPIGAGPFLLESMTLEEKIVLKPNPLYYNAENVKLAGVEIVHIASPEAMQNALRTGEIDLADGSAASTAVVDGVEGADGLEIFTRGTDSVLFWGQLCKAQAPFDNVLVRQAMNYGLDREELNIAVFDGASEPMDSGIESRTSPYFNPANEGYYAHDPAKAIELLTEAGYPDGFDIQILVPAEGGDQATFVQVVQAQWAEVGINVEIVQLPGAEILPAFFLGHTPEGAEYPLYFFPLGRSGLDRVTRNLVPGSIGNICSWDDPALNDIVADIRALDPNSDEAVEAWYAMDEYLLDNAANIFGIFGLTNNILNTDRVGGARYAQNFQGAPFIIVEDAFINS